MTTKAEAPAVQIDPQDALPESNWFWRRLYFGVLSLGLCGLILVAINKGYPASGIIALCVVLGIVVVVYGVAPSGEQAVKMIQTAGMLKAGVSLFQSQTATSDGATSRATATTAVNPPEKPAETP